MIKLQWPKDQKAARIDRQKTQHLTDRHTDTAVGSTWPNSAQHMGRCVPDTGRWVTSGRFVGARGDHMVHEVEVKMVQESQDEEIETVSIDLVNLNKNRFVITAHLETHACKNTVEVPYKIDMSSEDNIMLLYIFKKLFKNVTVEQLKNP